MKVLGEGENLHTAVDVEEVLRYFTVQVFVVNLDSYLGPTGHNYYLYEEDGKYNIILDIPGFSKEEIKLECHEGYIIVTAEKNKENEKNERNYIKKERIYGSIQRQFYVGDINQEEIKAEFKNGILKVIVPKEESKPEKKQIVIE